MRLRSSAGKTIQEKLASLAKSYLDILLREETVALYRIVLEVSTVFPHLAKLFYTSGPHSANRVIQKILEMAIDNGELDIPRSETLPAAQLFAAMVRGEPFHFYTLLGMDFPQKDLEAWISLAVDTFLAAYATPCKGQKKRI
jgi:hypothetical protein